MICLCKYPFRGGGGQVTCMCKYPSSGGGGGGVRCPVYESILKGVGGSGHISKFPPGVGGSGLLSV